MTQDSVRGAQNHAAAASTAAPSLPPMCPPSARSCPATSAGGWLLLRFRAVSWKLADRHEGAVGPRVAQRRCGAPGVRSRVEDAGRLRVAAFSEAAEHHDLEFVKLLF